MYIFYLLLISDLVIVIKTLVFYFSVRQCYVEVFHFAC